MTQIERRYRTTIKVKSSVLANNSLDLPGMGMQFAAIIVMLSLYPTYLGNKLFPNVSPDAFQLFIKGVIAFIAFFSGRIILADKKSRWDNLVAVNYDPDQSPFDAVYAIGCYFAIQVIGLIIQKVNLFQSTAMDIYFFYSASAIIEEALFRGAIMIWIQGILVKAFHLKERDVFMASIFAVVMSALIFVLAHERYYGNPSAIIVTLLGGISQGYWYLKTKSLYIVMLAHIIVNLIAAGGLIQTLGVV